MLVPINPPTATPFASHYVQQPDAADNPQAVPMGPAQLEANYSVIQDEPLSGSNGNRRQKRIQGSIQPTTRAIVRREEGRPFLGARAPTV